MCASFYHEYTFKINVENVCEHLFGEHESSTRIMYTRPDFHNNNNPVHKKGGTNMSLVYQIHTCLSIYYIGLVLTNLKTNKPSEF